MKVRLYYRLRRDTGDELNALPDQRKIIHNRAWGLEPQRIAAREPKGDVTLAKGLKPLR